MKFFKKLMQNLASSSESTKESQKVQKARKKFTKRKKNLDKRQTSTTSFKFNIHQKLNPYLLSKNTNFSFSSIKQLKSPGQNPSDRSVNPARLQVINQDLTRKITPFNLYQHDTDFEIFHDEIDVKSEAKKLPKKGKKLRKKVKNSKNSKNQPKINTHPPSQKIQRQISASILKAEIQKHENTLKKLKKLQDQYQNLEKENTAYKSVSQIQKSQIECLENSIKLTGTPDYRQQINKSRLIGQIAGKFNEDCEKITKNLIESEVRQPKFGGPAGGLAGDLAGHINDVTCTTSCPRMGFDACPMTEEITPGIDDLPNSEILETSVFESSLASDLEDENLTSISQQKHKPKIAVPNFRARTRSYKNNNLYRPDISIEEFTLNYSVIQGYNTFRKNLKESSVRKSGGCRKNGYKKRKNFTKMRNSKSTKTILGPVAYKINQSHVMNYSLQQENHKNLGKILPISNNLNSNFKTKFGKKVYLHKMADEMPNLTKISRPKNLALPSHPSLFAANLIRQTQRPGLNLRQKVTTKNSCKTVKTTSSSGYCGSLGMGGSELKTQHMNLDSKIDGLPAAMGGDNLKFFECSDNLNKEMLKSKFLTECRAGEFRFKGCDRFNVLLL